MQVSPGSVFRSTISFENKCDSLNGLRKKVEDRQYDAAYMLCS